MIERNDRTDFRELDPTTDPEHFEKIVASIMAAASPELQARRRRSNALGQVVSWWRPLLAAAALTGIVSVAALASVDSRAETTESQTGIAEAIGMPAQIAQWVRSDEAPDPAELWLTLEDDR
jgi:hypothetical protein